MRLLSWPSARLGTPRMSCTPHTAVGKSVSLPEETVQMLAAGQLPEGLPAQEKSAYEFAHQLAATHRVDADVYARAKAEFGDKSLVDIVMLAGLYLVTCAALNAFEVPVPQE